MFLKKVQRVIVTDVTGLARDSEIRKVESEEGLVEIHHGAKGEHRQQWLVVRQTHKPTMKREGMHRATTEVALAFELGNEQPRQQQVCAFLPLRKYGLKFIVQVRMSMLYSLVTSE